VSVGGLSVCRISERTAVLLLIIPRLSSVIAPIPDLTNSPLFLSSKAEGQLVLISFAYPLAANTRAKGAVARFRGTREDRVVVIYKVFVPLLQRTTPPPQMQLQLSESIGLVAEEDTDLLDQILGKLLRLLGIPTTHGSLRMCHLTTIQGKQGVHVTTITAYHVCKNTVHSRQRALEQLTCNGGNVAT
jgi:hypothetical protein